MLAGNGRKHYVRCVQIYETFNNPVQATVLLYPSSPQNFATFAAE